MKQSCFCFLLVIVGLALGLAPALAQVTTSGIRGTVADASGALIPGAKLTVTNQDTGFTRITTANLAGIYEFTLLPIGNYVLKAEAKGFKASLQSGITLTVGEVLGLNLTLQVGSASDTVEVSGGPPVVDTQTTEISTLVDSQQIQQLPLNGRNPIQLAALATGVNAVVDPIVIKGNDARSFNFLSISGSQEFTNTFLLDGGLFEEPSLNAAFMYPNPDAIEEFELITNMYNAEYGRSSGGVMSVITKSGTNQFHGSAWEFNRNSVFAAKNYFLPTAVPFLNQNQFGYTVGGPVKKNKVFMFASEQWLRIRQAATTTSAFPPTAAERQGDLSSISTPIIDPTTGQPFPGNIIPSNMLDPVYQKYLNLLPLPNFPDGSYRGAFSSPSNYYQVLLKPDADLTSRQHLSASIYWDRTTSTSPLDFGRFNVPLVNTTGPSFESNDVNVTTAIINYTWNMSPNMVNNARFQYLTEYLIDAAPGRGPTMSQLGANFPSFPLQDVPSIFNSEYETSTGNFTQYNTNEYLFADTVSYIRGAHSLKIGLQYLRQKFIGDTTSNNMGVFVGTGSVTGSDVADLLLGKAYSYASNNLLSDTTQGDWAGFIQDNYRASHTLTLNLGLRYEVANSYKPEPNYTAVTGGLLPGGFSFNSGQQSVVYKNAPTGFLFPYSPAFRVGDPGVPSTLAYTDKTNFVPRIGFALDVFGNGKTAVRAGFGMFREIMQEGALAEAISGPPYFINYYQALTQNFVNPVASLIGKFPVLYTPDLDFTPFEPMSFSFLDPHFTNPLVDQVNFTIQQALGSKSSLQIAYVGAFGFHLLRVLDINQPVYIPGTDPNGNPLSTVANEVQRSPLNKPFLPDTPYGKAAEAGNTGASNYNGLQVQERTQTLHGLSLSVAYTWSKTIDYNSDLITSTDSGFAQNSNCPQCERGLSDYDHRNIFTGSIVYDFPSLTRLGVTNPVAREVLDNWEATSIISLTGGSPFDVATGSDQSLTGTDNDRPNLVGNPFLPTNRPRSQLIHEYFNTAAFVPNPIGTFGNEGRNILIGPGYSDVDFGLFKNIKFEKMQLQIRGEAFNLFNRVSLSAPNATLSSPTTLGHILTAGNSRVLQFGGKLSF